MNFSKVEEAIEDIRLGKMIIVTDNEDRENEGDLVMAGELVTPEDINFMVKYGRGLICAPITTGTAEKLGFPLMTTEEDKQGTAFTVSCDLKSGTTTGISPSDRAKTIKALCNKESKAGDFTRPGHVFPLIAKDGGVLEREGHTEASVDLALLAGLKPCGVICEIISDNGEMARVPELKEFSKKHNLKWITIEELKAYKEYLYERKPIEIPTDIGSFFLETVDNPGCPEMPHLFIYDKFNYNSLNLRIHSECLTGDLLGSLRCDCGDQLKSALAYIKENGGAILYLRQEGRGIGLINKLRAYNLQDKGYDTLDANLKLGFRADERNYNLAAGFLKSKNIKSVNLLTNNPLKVNGLEKEGVKVNKRIPLEGRVCKSNKYYLDTKRERMGHLLSLQEETC